MSQLLEELRGALADRYHVESEVGRGGMAAVYLAEDLKLGRRVAIKVLSPELSSSIDKDRFRQEIQIAARLNHPHIVPVFESGDANGLLYYTMPFIEGESLRKRIERETQLGIDDALAIAGEVADALSYAHAFGVVHRDIKPENILIHGGHAVVADFGIARVIEEAGGEKLTKTGTSIGTAAYMSPEQFSGAHLDGRSDMYSLACVLYEMLVGQVPFTGPNAVAIMARHTMEAVPSIQIVRSTVPDELEDAIMRALEKVPADRFTTVAQFKEALVGTGGTSTHVRRTRAHTAAMRTATASAIRVRRRKRTLAYGVLALALLAGGSLAGRYYWTRFRVANGDIALNRIAVLYFGDGANGQLRYLADALTESLIDQLSAVPALDVLSRGAVRPYRGGDVSLDSIGRALQVGSLVRGELEPSRNGVKVTVRLVDAAANVDVARRSFTLDTLDAAMLQREAATEVASFLREQLGPQIRLREQRGAAGTAASWLLVQRAEKRRKDADSLQTLGVTEAAVIAFDEADSLLARAEQEDKSWVVIPTNRALIAYAKAQALRGDPTRMTVAIDSGIAFARRARERDPRSADALEYEGELLWLRFTEHLIADPRESERTLALAESLLTRSVQINANQAGAWATLSGVYYRKPDLQAALTAAYNAYRADAYLASAKTILVRLFDTSHNLEQFPEAMRYCDEGKRRFPRDPFFVECRLWMYMTPYARPDPDSAWAYAEQYVQMHPEKARERARKKAQIFVAGGLFRASLPDSARHLLLASRATPQLDPTRGLEGYEAAVRVMLGDQDEAVRLIQDYLTVNPEHRAGFTKRIHWWWRDLQGNPKFKAVIAGAG